MQTKTDIDMIVSEDCIGKRVFMVAEPTIKGHVTQVTTLPAGRSYTVDWFHEGGLHSANFYGFQLRLED